MAVNHYIYIDDSGDPGLKEASSSNFVIAAVIVVGVDARDKLEKTLSDFRSSLGWRTNEELKFNKTNRKYVRAARSELLSRSIIKPMQWC